MKFARYLEEAQTPEWKKAYIDYRGLKKCITAIRKVQIEYAIDEAAIPKRQPSPHDPDTTVVGSPVDNELKPESPWLQSADIPVNIEDVPSSSLTSPPPTAVVRFPDVICSNADLNDTERPLVDTEPSARDTIDSHEHEHQSHSTTVNNTFPPHLRRRTTSVLFTRGNTIVRRASSLHPQGHDLDLNKSIPLMVLFPLLTPVERQFFNKLDAELDKIEGFYCARERDMKTRSIALKEQLQSLKDHRKLFHETHPDDQHFWIPRLHIIRHTLARSIPLTNARKHRKHPVSPPPERSHSEGPSHVQTETLTEIGEIPSKTTTESQDLGIPERLSQLAADKSEKPRSWSFFMSKSSDANIIRKTSNECAAVRLDPEEYQHAKKKLKKAVVEYYRGLEVLNNYRTLNLIGFRKALKKFEKVTKKPAQEAYIKEKVETSSFSSGATVNGMIKEMEELFAARFVRGDKKKALAHLRGDSQLKSHHFSTFRTGIILGLALPAFVSGLYQSFQQDTRAAIPGWAGLLFVYSLFLVPTLFSLLVGLNVLVWSNARINYAFIFELDIRTRLDHREYFEIPAILLSTLCYAFWISFSRIGQNNISPTIWPLLWLIFTVVVMVDPLPIQFKPSRWWLLRNIGRLLTSGTHRVEFADFWMGDQFCSLVFTLSNLYFVGCAYAHGLDASWRHCMGGTNWAIPWLIGTLPLWVRLVQSIKRWADSRLTTHLINGGKYASGIIYYLFYFLWRRSGGGRGASFVLWCIFGTNYSIYASAWDLLMDWSVLRPHARYPLLREELIYTNNIPLYYVAIVMNTLIRFIWVFYIPIKGPDFVLRTFIAGMLEMLRRVQWNFIRLENEHLGNVDQYRVTREVPLPYTFDDRSHDSDGGDEEDRVSISSFSWRRQHRRENGQ